MMVDEADIDLVGGGTGSHGKGSKRSAESLPSSPRPNKRKPGPIPKDVLVKRPTTPPPLPPVLIPEAPLPPILAVQPTLHLPASSPSDIENSGPPKLTMVNGNAGEYTFIIIYTLDVVFFIPYQI